MRPALVLVVVLAAVALAAWLFWPGAGDAPVAPLPVHDAPSAGAALASSAAAADAPGAAPSRREIGGGETFVSESEDDGVLANAVRDGLTILLLGEDRQPRAGAKLDVRWRKGFGMYGNDRGVTDGSGRFPTTVAEHEMLEGITLSDPAHGELRSHGDFLPMATDPRTVVCTVPSLQPVTVRIVDEQGTAIAGASVAAERGAVDVVQREFALVCDESQAVADRDGIAVLHLPAGAHVLKATADHHEAIYSLRCAVGPGGRKVTMHLLSNANRHDVAVTVAAPADFRSSITVGGFTKQVPALPGLEPDGVEPVQVQFTGRERGPRTFVVEAPPMPWRCWARADPRWGGADVDAFATSVTVELPAAQAQPVAKLRCKLLLPNGEPTYGEVMIHTTPDLVYGGRQQVSVKEPFARAEPGNRACVSGWHYRYPPAIVGPIDLVGGEQEVVLQLAEPQSIRGRVVDENGAPVKATVVLLRPAGPLRTLGDEVPPILESGASGDSLGTNDDGEFRFEEVGAGEHGLAVVPERTGWPAYVRVKPGDQNVVVKLGAGIDDRARIQGRVTLATTGAPVRGAQVRWLGEQVNDSTYTDADGRYAIAVPPGTVHVTVMARRCAFLQSEPEPFAAALHRRDLVVTPSEPLFVRVRDEAGRVPKVEICAFDAKGRELPFVDHNGNWDGDVAHLDGNGRAELGGLPHAPLRLRLQTEDETQTMDVDVPAAFARTADFAITWQPQSKRPDAPK